MSSVSVMQYRFKKRSTRLEVGEFLQNVHSLDLSDRRIAVKNCLKHENHMTAFLSPDNREHIRQNKRRREQRKSTPLLLHPDIDEHVSNSGASKRATFDLGEEASSQNSEDSLRRGIRSRTFFRNENTLDLSVDIREALDKSYVRLHWFCPRKSSCNCSKCRCSSDLRDILDRNTKQKIIFYIHGGVYSKIDTEVHRASIARLAANAEMLVIGASYRRSPEVPIAVTIADCLHSYLYIIMELRVHPKRIVLAGDSAGGALCMQIMFQIISRAEIFHAVANKLSAKVYANTPKIDRIQYPSGHLRNSCDMEGDPGSFENATTDLQYNAHISGPSKAADFVLTNTAENLLPCRVALVSPWVDMSEANDRSFQVNHFCT